MSSSIKQLYDISFIQINNSPPPPPAPLSTIDLNSRNIYNIRSINITPDSSLIKDPIIKFGRDLFTDRRSQTQDLITYNNLARDGIGLSLSDYYSITSTFIDSSNTFCDIVKASGTFYIVNLDCSNITTSKVDCSGLFSVQDISFINFSTKTIDSSNIESINLYSKNLTLTNTSDISKNLNFYNSYITLDSSYNNNFDFIKVNNKKLISYHDNSFTVIDSSFVILYGVLRVNNLICDSSYSFDSTYFGTTNVLVLQGSSDDRIKHNQVDISNAIETINKLTPKTYIKTKTVDPSDNNFIYSSGYIAQEISNNVPELSHVINDSNNKLSLNYIEIQPYITQSIIELNSLVNNNDVSINNLSQRLSLLENT